jgi:hypothetical protein
MRLVSLVALVCVLAACSTTPPSPPQCEGEFHPINIQQKGVSSLNREKSMALCAGEAASAKA